MARRAFVEAPESGVAYTILGRLEIRVGGQSLDLRGRKRRVLLARLLVDADNVVAVGDLIETLWPEGRAPRSATGTLQTYISQLRRLLGSCATHLETRAPGYVLAAEPGSVDASRFESSLVSVRNQAELSPDVV